MVGKLKERQIAAIDVLLGKLKEQLIEHPELFSELVGSNEKSVPVSAFRPELGMQEAVCLYLKDEQGLSFKEIAAVLHRDYKTVWTAYSKATKKVKHVR
ncbi:MAG: sigma factor-like helix-turn-helix DNA-binding protein [Nanoarchaeota archaeon]|nr:sigma factor-like helix-turn-helix DNA-binding protein [Nanoarchaeota archaeon]